MEISSKYGEILQIERIRDFYFPVKKKLILFPLFPSGRGLLTANSVCDEYSLNTIKSFAASKRQVARNACVTGKLAANAEAA